MAPDPNSPTPALDPTFSKPDPKVAVRTEVKGPLVAIGVALVVLAIVVAGLSWGLGTKTTETEPGKQSASAKIEKTKKTYAGPSETLLTAVIGSGAALILIGFLYGRISSIKLPGGVDLELTPDEAEKATEKALEALPDNPDPKVAAKAIQQTQDAVLATKAAMHSTSVAEVPEEQIEQVATNVVESVN
jgi:hypothetical protein